MFYKKTKIAERKTGYKIGVLKDTIVVKYLVGKIGSDENSVTNMA